MEKHSHFQKTINQLVCVSVGLHRRIYSVIATAEFHTVSGQETNNIQETENMEKYISKQYTHLYCMLINSSVYIAYNVVFHPNKPLLNIP